MKTKKIKCDKISNRYLRNFVSFVLTSCVQPFWPLFVMKLWWCNTILDMKDHKQEWLIEINVSFDCLPFIITLMILALFKFPYKTQNEKWILASLIILLIISHARILMIILHKHETEKIENKNVLQCSTLNYQLVEHLFCFDNFCSSNAGNQPN